MSKEALEAAKARKQAAILARQLGVAPTSTPINPMVVAGVAVAVVVVGAIVYNVYRGKK